MLRWQSPFTIHLHMDATQTTIRSLDENHLATRCIAQSGRNRIYRRHLCYRKYRVIRGMIDLFWRPAAPILAHIAIQMMCARALMSHKPFYISQPGLARLECATTEFRFPLYAMKANDRSVDRL